LIHHPLFSLTLSAQRKKLSKKETPEKKFRHLRMATAERGGSAKPFEKGLSQNFKQINSPLNPNLYI
jgi:hypothetical protein